MLYKNSMFGLIALVFCIEMVIALTTAPHYLNTTSPANTATSTQLTKLELPASPTDIITIPDQGEAPSHVDPSQDIPSITPTHAAPTATPSTSIEEPAEIIPVDPELPEDEDPITDGDLPLSDSDPDPPTPKLVVPPGSSGDPVELQDEVPPGLEPDQVFEDGDAEDDGNMMAPADEEVLIDETGTQTEISVDAEPAEPVLGIDDAGTFVLLPSEDSDPATEESFSIVPKPGPDQTVGATHTLTGIVATLSSGLGVVLPGSTVIPVDPFLPALTGSTTVINSQTFVVVANPTTIPLVAPSRPSPTSTITNSIPGRITSISGSLNAILPGPTTVPVNSFLPDLQGRRTTMISGTLNVVFPSSARVLVNENLSGLTGKTTVIGTQTFVDILSPTTVLVNVPSPTPIQPTSAPGDIVPDAPFGDSPESGGSRFQIGRWDVIVFLLGVVFMVGMW
ncbi:hypothetical protein DL98DRAFT_536344 [Cadophora sp. DSE1049]|nr:hypothetical protein DL98DRAFT_536344 [Cadophora sp. DSE1049]